MLSHIQLLKVIYFEEKSEQFCIQTSVLLWSLHK